MKLTHCVAALVLGIVVTPWTGSAQTSEEEHHHGSHTEVSRHPEGKADGHSHEQAELHGGKVIMTGQHHFETVFALDGIRIYKYSADQAPLMMQKTGGTANLKYKDGTRKEIPLSLKAPEKREKTVYFCPMHPEVVQMEAGVCDQCGGMKLFIQDYLHAKVDLSKIEPGAMKAIVHLRGLKGSESEVTFTETYEGTADPHEGRNHESEHHHHDPRQRSIFPRIEESGSPER